MIFSLLTHNLELHIIDTALKVSRCLYCFTTSISHGVKTISPGCGVRASLMLFCFSDLQKLPVEYLEKIISYIPKSPLYLVNTFFQKSWLCKKEELCSGIKTCLF